MENRPIIGWREEAFKRLCSIGLLGRLLKRRAGMTLYPFTGDDYRDGVFGWAIFVLVHELGEELDATGADLLGPLVDAAEAVFGAVDVDFQNFDVVGDFDADLVEELVAEKLVVGDDEDVGLICF